MTECVLNLSDLVEQDASAAPPLDLPSIDAERFFTPRGRRKYMLYFSKVKRSFRPDECPFCKKKKQLILSGHTSPRLIHDYIRENCRVDIIIEPVRLLCKHCGQRFVMRIPDINKDHRMTIRLFEYIKEQCFIKSHTALSEISGVSIETIRRILYKEIQKFEEERKNNPLPAPRVLGIDEKHINHKMRGTIVDVDEGILLDMVSDNKENTMKAAIMRLKNWDTKIEVVTTDMNNSYLRWLPSFLPNATIITDKFHVIKDIQQHISVTKKDLYAFRKENIHKMEDVKERTRLLGILNMLILTTVCLITAWNPLSATTMLTKR